MMYELYYLNLTYLFRKLSILCVFYIKNCLRFEIRRIKTKKCRDSWIDPK